MADTPAQASLRAAFDSKLSVIPQTLSQEKQTQAQTNIGGPFLPLSGGTVSGTISATAFSGPLTGSASTSSKWATARNISLSGDATGSVSLDGSADATLNLTIANGSVTNAMLASDSVTFSKVSSGDVATQAEAEAGTVNNVFMTPLRVAQAIAALGGNPSTYVTETHSDGNGNWYRVWSDGFIEQGGAFQLGEAQRGEYSITLNKPFSTISYTVLQNVYSAEAQNREGCGIASKTTTTFKFQSRAGINAWRDWIAFGY